MKKGLLFFLLSVSLLSCYQDIPEPPTVVFDYFVPGCDKCDCKLPCQVNFRNDSENADYFEWDLGDGTTHVGHSLTHTYTKPGLYQVQLTGRGKGGVAGASASVMIREPAPEADFSLESDEGDFTAPCQIRFTNLSRNADRFSWNFGTDATYQQVQTQSDITYTYQTAGQYTVTLIATSFIFDNVISKTIRIKNPINIHGRFRQRGYSNTISIEMNAGSPDISVYDATVPQANPNGAYQRVGANAYTLNDRTILAITADRVIFRDGSGDWEFDRIY